MRFRITYIVSSAVKSVWRSVLVYLFSVIGSAALDFAVYMLLVGVFSAPRLLAQAVSYTAGALNRYFAYKLIKFRGRPAAGEFLRFAALNTVMLIIWVQILALLSMACPGAIAKILVTALSAAVNAFLNRYAVFGT